MSRNILNQDSQTTSVVVTNRMTATLPIEQTQADFTSPILIGLKGLSGMGSNGQVIKTNGTSLYYDTDNGSKWTIDGSNIYPTTATQVLVNTATNANNRKLLVNGDAEITSKLYLTDKLVLSAATNQLSDGTNNYILPSNSGTLQLTNDAANTAPATLFGTSVAGGNTIKMGNAAGTAQTTNLELYFSASLKLYNTSNTLIGQFTPVSNTCYLSLNGGIISGAVWNGSSIPFNFGGTGLTGFGIADAGKILQVNSTTNGYDLINLPDELFNVVNTTEIIADPQGNDSNVCSKFTISSGQGSNGDCLLLIRANTDDNTVTSNPRIQLQQADTLANAFLEFDNNNYFYVGNAVSGGNTILYTNGGVLGISNDSGSTNNIATFSSSLVDLKSTATKALKLQTDAIEGITDTANKITSNTTYGWDFEAGTTTRAIAIKNGSNGYPFIGSSSSSVPFLIHINNIADAYNIENSNNTQDGFKHFFYGSDVNFNKIIANNDTANTIESNPQYGWEFNAGSNSRAISIPRGNYYPFIGSTADNEPYNLHINGIGDAYYIQNTSNNLAGLEHNFRGSLEMDTVGANFSLSAPSASSQPGMSKLRLGNDNDVYFVRRAGTNNNDLYLRFTGGDMFFFASNDPDNGDAYQALLFINESSNNALYLAGSGGAINIQIGNNAFTGNRSYTGSSDDRLKHDEQYIENATQTLMKLRPQTYSKDNCLKYERDRKDPSKIIENENIIQTKEAGLIAQEVYYQAPELRHLVHTNSGDIQELPEGTNIDDIKNDIDYVSLGWNEYMPSAFSYTELIPYLIKSNQEQQEEINTLREEVDTLKSQMSQILSQLNIDD